MRARVVSVCLLLSALVCGVGSRSAVVQGQALGELAAREQARRKAIGTPARVITTDDLAVPTAARTAEPQETAEALDDPRRPRAQVAPARLRSGALPQIPVQAVSAGEVILEVKVDRTGRVEEITPLRHTPPFTAAVVEAVRGWTFAPAEDAPVPPAGTPVPPASKRPMDATVLVVAMFRPPSLFGGTLGEPPANVGRPSGDAPFPLVPLELPLYPPNALADGVVMLELDVASHGGVSGATVVRSSPAFDKAALGAVSALSFAPGRAHGRQARAFVYVVAAFRQPITF